MRGAFPKWIVAFGPIAVTMASCTAPEVLPSGSSSSGTGGAGESGCANGICNPYTCDTHYDKCRTMCASTAECISGYVCQGGFCFGTECTENNAPSVCGAYACVKGVCARDCASTTCAQGFYCRGDTNECVSRCTSRGDPICNGYVCDIDVGECEPICIVGQLPCAAGYACSLMGTCDPDVQAPACASGCGAYVCVTKFDRCATHCVANDDCVSPATCQGGQCLP